MYIILYSDKERKEDRSLYNFKIFKKLTNKSAKIFLIKIIQKNLILEFDII